MNVQSSQSTAPNIADILLFLLSKWPWFLLSLVLCVAFAWYRASTEPLVYYASTKVIIKDPRISRRAQVLSVIRTQSTRST